MQILVLTSCTREKKHKPSNQLKYEDFASADRLRKRTAELKHFEAPAAEMYTGRQHRPLMEGLKQLREIHGPNVVDLYIISAGYGLLNENKVIVPYDVTFGKRKKEISELSESLQIHEQVENLVVDYDLVFFLLGEKYVRALKLPFQNTDSVTKIFLLGNTHRKLIPDTQNFYFVAAGNDLAHKLSVMSVALKGFVFKRLCEVVCNEELQVFGQIKQNPQMLVKIVLNQ